MPEREHPIFLIIQEFTREVNNLAFSKNTFSPPQIEGKGLTNRKIFFITEKIYLRSAFLRWIAKLTC